MKKNNFIVFTKSIFAVLLIATTLILSSCSNDSITDRVKKDVDDSEWSALYYGNQYYLTFDDGEYTLSYIYDGNRESITGHYSQKGVYLTFQEITFFTHTTLALKRGNISQMGSEMIVPIYDMSTNDVLYTFEFKLEYLDD